MSTNEQIENTRMSNISDGNNEQSSLEMGVKQRNGYDYFGSNAQGAQGSQMKIQSQMDHFDDESPDAMGFPQKAAPLGGQLNEFDPNTTQTNALLLIRDNKCNYILQQVYYSEKCSWFYIGLLVLSFGLILVTIFDGFQVAESPMFIILEFVLNLLIGIDFGCRLILVGCRKYARDPTSGKIRWWNIFDALVVTVCNIVFLITLFSKTGAVKGFEEASEEGLIVMWCVWQTLRMILIAKKQRLARQSAKTLINFENIVVDTDFGGALSFRASIGGERNNLSGDPDDIVVELANFDKDEDQEKNRGSSQSETSKARLRGKINAKSSVVSTSSGNRFGRSGSGVQKNDEFNNINRYVIDDDEDDSQMDSHRMGDGVPDTSENINTSNNSSSSAPREIIFDIED